jgi:hypothetical protein
MTLNDTNRGPTENDQCPDGRNVSRRRLLPVIGRGQSLTPPPARPFIHAGRYSRPRFVNAVRTWLATVRP